MYADFLIKFALTTGAVWLVLDLAQRCGERVAGLAAGLPITSLPTLAVLGLDHGDAFVAEAATGALLAVASSALFAVVYFRLTAGPRGCSRATSLTLALGAAATLSIGLYAGQGAGAIGGVGACFLAALASGGAAALVHSTASAALPGPAERTSHLPVALLVGGVSAMVCWLASAMSAPACGLLAGAPTVSVVVLLRQHRLHGHAGAARLLDGYVSGLGMRVAFLALVACADRTGWAWALCLGLVGAFGCRVFTRDRAVVPRRFARRATNAWLACCQTK